MVRKSFFLSAFFVLCFAAAFVFESQEQCVFAAEKITENTQTEISLPNEHDQEIKDSGNDTQAQNTDENKTVIPYSYQFEFV